MKYFQSHTEVEAVVFSSSWNITSQLWLHLFLRFSEPKQFQNMYLQTSSKLLLTRKVHMPKLQKAELTRSVPSASEAASRVGARANCCACAATRDDSYLRERPCDNPRSARLYRFCMQIVQDFFMKFELICLYDIVFLQYISKLTCLGFVADCTYCFFNYLYFCQKLWLSFL